MGSLSCGGRYRLPTPEDGAAQAVNTKGSTAPSGASLVEMDMPPGKRNTGGTAKEERMLSGRGFQITPLLAFIRAGALPSCSALLHQDSRQEYAGAFLVPADSISFVCMLPPENGSFPSSRMDAGY